MGVKIPHPHPPQKAMGKMVAKAIVIRPQR